MEPAKLFLDFWECAAVRTEVSPTKKERNIPRAGELSYVQKCCPPPSQGGDYSFNPRDHDVALLVRFCVQLITCARTRFVDVLRCFHYTFPNH